MRNKMPKCALIASSIACLAVLASTADANNFGPKKKTVEPVQRSAAKTPVRTNPLETCFVEVFANPPSVPAGGTVLVEYWLYVDQSATLEGLGRDFSIEGQVINVLMKRSNGQVAYSDNPYTGNYVFFDPDLKKFVAREGRLHSPAEGRLIYGDVVESIGGRTFADEKELSDIVCGLEPNVPVPYAVVRDSVPQTVMITPRHYADDSHVYNQSEAVSLGVFADFDSPDGAVTVVSGPGLEKGDVLKEVDGTAIRTWDDWARIAAIPVEGREYSFLVSRNGNEVIVPITAAKRNISITADILYPSSGDDVRREEITVRGRRYVKARVLKIRTRFTEPGTFRIDPGSLRMRMETPGAAGHFGARAKSVPNKEAIYLPTQPLEVVVTPATDAPPTTGTP